MGEKEEAQDANPPAAKQPWVEPKLKAVGTVGDVLQGGGGKLSVVGGDPGEMRKQSSSG